MCRALNFEKGSTWHIGLSDSVGDNGVELKGFGYLRYKGNYHNSRDGFKRVEIGASSFGSILVKSLDLSVKSHKISDIEFVHELPDDDRLSPEAQVIFNFLDKKEDDKNQHGLEVHPKYMRAMSTDIVELLKEAGCLK